MKRSDAMDRQPSLSIDAFAAAFTRMLVISAMFYSGSKISHTLVNKTLDATLANDDHDNVDGVYDDDDDDDDGDDENYDDNVYDNDFDDEYNYDEDEKAKKLIISMRFKQE
ncbi:hypothetical protein ElyMa_001866500 [Elysia marginata]|uniref:Uncharacterized protein n=1 Tax=Elysia marginata TaxID=1093978 RepID=A0AAV4EN29_9GAST|nr:hypothetical protein ElyMa_001866500 [Elysia marginata]